MESVSTAAFLKSAHMARMMGGSEKAVANREIALARTFSLGGFGFDAIVEDGGLDNDSELLATFLYNLMHPHDATIKLELAMEMVKEDKAAVIKAVSSANPRNAPLTDKTGQGEASIPAAASVPPPSNAPGSPSATPGVTSQT